MRFDFIFQLVEDEQRNGGERRLVAGRNRVGPARIRRRIIVDDLLAQLDDQAIHERVHLVLARWGGEEIFQERLRLENVLAAEVEERQLQLRRQRFVLSKSATKIECAHYSKSNWKKSLSDLDEIRQFDYSS